MKRSRTTVSIEHMSAERKLLTAAELDQMSPNERSEAFRSCIVRDLGELTPEFRDVVLQTGRRLMNERSPHPRA